MRKQPLTGTDHRHGTYRGAAAHHRQHVPLCEPCRLAWNAYRNGYRTPRYDGWRALDLHDLRLGLAEAILDLKGAA